MDEFVIHGGRRLRGSIKVSGSKNSVLPIMAAAILGESPSVIEGAPRLRDVRTMLSILADLGMQGEHREDGSICLNPVDNTPVKADYRKVSTMRGSICVLGPLLARRRKAVVSLPGGCIIGLRPVDLHIKGLRALGARISIERGYVVAEAERLVGSEIYLGGSFGSSVLATANIMMAATLAEGETVIDCAACEPEVADLAAFLNAMGARITGAGSPTVTIEGVKHLAGARHRVIPDRIEAGTLMMAAAATGGDVILENVNAAHLGAVVDKLKQVGVCVEKTNGSLRVTGSPPFKSTDLTTLPYPGMPTDLQAQMMAMLTTSDGISVVTDKVYPDRFMHVGELNRMGADIRKEGSSAIIRGVDCLSGCEVMASDLRASAALVIAGLVAKGETEIHRVYHIDRGYEQIEQRLNQLGADIYRTVDEKEA
ncbi:MAG TPA: UDP-N-acetylglucosamine 1-carboxyvinyltransferase [Planctomycetota bacterium]|nr:UDP-N-acetylglucosamine 1-carboxyvinyltransferase [Planctomycetota bacterium]